MSIMLHSLGATYITGSIMVVDMSSYVNKWLSTWNAKKGSIVVSHAAQKMLSQVIVRPQKIQVKKDEKDDCNCNYKKAETLPGTCNTKSVFNFTATSVLTIPEKFFFHLACLTNYSIGHLSRCS